MPSSLLLHNASKLDAARQHDACMVAMVNAYCRNPGCVIRHVSAEAKEQDAQTPATLRCPACRRLLEIHDVKK